MRARILFSVALAITLHILFLRSASQWLTMKPWKKPIPKAVTLELKRLPTESQEIEEIKKEPDARIANASKTEVVRKEVKPKTAKSPKPVIPKKPEPIPAENRPPDSAKKPQALRPKKMTRSPEKVPQRLPAPDLRHFSNLIPHVPTDSGPTPFNQSEVPVIPAGVTDPALDYREERLDESDMAMPAEIFPMPPPPVLREARPLYRKNPPPEYPERARRRGYEGVVILDVLVRSDGRVGDVRVLTSSGHATLDKAAASSVGRWIFEPGKSGDQRVDMRVKVPIRFQLK